MTYDSLKLFTSGNMAAACMLNLLILVSIVVIFFRLGFWNVCMVCMKVGAREFVSLRAPVSKLI